MAKADPQSLWRGGWQKRRQKNEGRSRSPGGWSRRRSLGGFEQLELRTMLAGGVIELGPSDNVALDQPRVAIELFQDTGAATYRYDFGPAASPVEPGFVGASTAPFNGTFGWRTAAGLSATDRGPTGSDLNRDFVSVTTAQATFSRAVANGTYHVQVHLGDLTSTLDDMAVWFEGESSSAHPLIDTAAGEVVVKSYTVEVTDGILDVHLHDRGGANHQLAIVGLEVVDAGTDSGSGWASVGPGVFNTFLLDTGANSVLAMASAVGDMMGPPVPYQTDGTFREVGVAGYHDMDISVDYRFDFAGSSGIRHTVLDTRIQSDANNDFSIFGPWGLAGMPAMAGRVTTLDMTGWSGGAVDLEDLYMKVDFSEDMPAGNGHRYALAVDNRLAFDPMDYMVDPVNDEPPIWADIPFLTAIPTQNGIGREGNFLFDTGAQISVISERLALQLGLDSNGNGLLDEGDDNYVTTESVGGVGGTVPAPVFTIDEVHVPVRKVLADGELGDEVELVWTNLQWLVLDIETDEATTLDGVFGSDLLTSGWFYSFFYGLEDGYFDQVHFDFQDWGLYNGAPEPRQGTVYFDLNPLKDQSVDPGPGVRIRHSGGSTQVAENGGTDTYTVVLTGEPAADVTVQLANTDGQVRAVNQANGNNTVVFTPSNWDVAQTVLVAGENDSLAEGPHTGTITHTVTSADPAYAGLAVPDMEVSIADEDVNVVTITSDAAGNNVVDSIQVAEGEKVTYWVQISSPPLEDSVVIIEDIGGGSQVHVSNPDDWGIENWWVFLADQWDQPQPVEVTAVNDSHPEGPHQIQLVHTVIDGITPIGQSVLPVNIADDDLGHVTITETNQSTLVVEGEDTDSYQIALDLDPGGAVVEITATAGSQLELSGDGGATYRSSLVLSFTDTTPQTITVRAFDDPVEEGAHTGRITHAVTGVVSDSRYPLTLSIQSVSASILDNDTAGVTISADAAGENVVTSISAVEGADVNYWVALNSQPTQDVTMFLESSSPQVTIVDAANPDHAFLVFTPENSSTPQAIRVSTVDNGIQQGTQTAQVTMSAFSADPQYQGSAVSTMTVDDPVVTQASVVGRYVFYNNSAFDGADPAANFADDYAIALGSSVEESGMHAGLDNQSVLTDATKTWTTDAWVGYWVVNLTDGSRGRISGNTANSITATFGGGVENDWDSGDDYAVVRNKTALLPGGTATFDNTTSYSRGINGLMVDIAGLADANAVTLADFTFRTSSNGVNWTAAPDPLTGSPWLRAAAGADGADRFSFLWSDGSIKNAWLEVTVGIAGMTQPDVFYFGNLVADTGPSPGVVNLSDYSQLAQNYGKTGVPITHPVDFDRGGSVGLGDYSALAQNYGKSLALFTAPVPLWATGGETAGTAQATLLSVDALEPVARAAVARWAAAGGGAELRERLAKVEFHIADLPAGQLGMAYPDAGVVYLDDDAAGYGWFVDRTPRADEEFSWIAETGALVNSNEATGAQIDLLSVVLHELGHMHGLADEDGDGQGVMTGELGPGVRRLPEGVEPVGLHQRSWGQHQAEHRQSRRPYLDVSGDPQDASVDFRQRMPGRETEHNSQAEEKRREKNSLAVLDWLFSPT